VDQSLDYDFRCVFLCLPRWILFRRIDARCEQMILAGLVEEVAELLLAGRLKMDSSAAARAIGYRQTTEYLKSLISLFRVKPLSLIQQQDTFHHFLAGFMAASRQYASQQIKWFRKDPRFVWIPAGEHTGLTTSQDPPAEQIRRLLDFDPGQFESFLATEPDRPYRQFSVDEAGSLRTYQTQLQVIQRGSPEESRILERISSFIPQLERSGLFASHHSTTEPMP